MGVFEDIFVKAKAATDAITEKAGQYIDVSKLNIKLAELKGDLKFEYESLGKTVHEIQKSGFDGKAKINASVAQIDNIIIQIEELKKQIASIKNKVLCSACEHQNDAKSLYCAKCGNKLIESDNPADTKDDDFAEFDI